MKMPSMIIATTLVLSVAACGGRSTPEQSTPAQAPSAQAPTVVESNAIAATTGSPALGIERLKACEIVTPQEASEIIGGELLNEPPTGLPNCAYVLDVKGTTESYRLSFSTPDIYVAMLESQNEEERGEPVAGLWDEAYVQPRAIGSGYSLVVIQRGKLALEVSGDRKEPLVPLAKLAVLRVP
jgi:hypothetical protein